MAALSTCYDLVMSYGDIELGNIGSGNGSLPDDTKPLPEPWLISEFQWQSPHGNFRIDTTVINY